MDLKPVISCVVTQIIKWECWNSYLSNLLKHSTFHFCLALWRPLWTPVVIDPLTGKEKSFPAWDLPHLPSVEEAIGLVQSKLLPAWRKWKENPLMLGAVFTLTQTWWVHWCSCSGSPMCRKPVFIMASYSCLELHCHCCLFILEINT